MNVSTAERLADLMIKKQVLVDKSARCGMRRTAEIYDEAAAAIGVEIQEIMSIFRQKSSTELREDLLKKNTF